MQLKSSCLILLLIISLHITAQVNPGPEIAWQRCYGGSNHDYFRDAIKTSDGGYLAALSSHSTDGDITGDEPYSAWIIKFDSVFNIEWQKFYLSDTCFYAIYRLLQLSNGNYMLVGSSGGEDCLGYEGGDGDFMLAEIDQSGNILWQQLHGSPGSEGIYKAIETSDKGFLCTATGLTSGGDIPFHYDGGMGTTDAIIFKTDSVGNLLWLKNLGGSNHDGPIGDPVEISKGQYIISLVSLSDDYDLAESGIPGPKRWTIQMDSTGEISKESFFDPYDLTTNDGSTTQITHYINPIGKSYAESPLFPGQEGHALEEGAVGFIDTATLQLQNIISWGGSDFDALRRFTRDENGNYYFLGFSLSKDYDLPGNYNGGEEFDYWLMATDSNFNLMWSRNFGGSDPCGDLGCSSFDGKLIYNNNMLYAFVKSTTDMVPDHDIECGHPSGAIGFGFTDAWLVAFDLTTVNIEDSQPDSELFRIYPNPGQNTLYIESEMQPYKQLSIEIITMEGQVVFQFTSTYSSLITLDIQNIIAGIYHINIYSENKIPLHSSKLVINKP